jgi:hypothetical protein
VFGGRTARGARYPALRLDDNRWHALAARCSESHYWSMKSSSDRQRGSSRAERGSDRKRTVANATAAGAADEVLKASELPISVVTELGRAQIPPEKFAAVLSAFGRLSERGQSDLAVRIIKASAIYSLRKSVEKQQFALRYEQRRHLKRISTSAKHLLALLGITDAKSVARGISPSVEIRVNKVTIPPTVTIHPAELPPTVTIHPTANLLLTWLYRVAVERRPATANVGAGERLINLILLLSDLAEAVEQCELETGRQYVHSRGGNRRKNLVTAEVELVQGLIESYAELRNRFPNSGPQLAFDQPLRKFVGSALRLVASASRFVDPNLPTRITDAAIRGAFNRLR